MQINQVKYRNKTYKLYQVLLFLHILFLSEILLAQNNTLFANPDKEPITEVYKSHSNLISTTLDTGIRSNTSSLISGCKPVEIGNTAAFSTAMITYRNIVIPIRNVNAAWMPPEPYNPDLTINGVDSDGDCVRDDIERYIGMLFKDRNQQRLRKYLFEYAKWLGMFIKISHWSIETTRAIYRDIYGSAECVRRIHLDTIETRALLDNIFANVYNTHNRSVQYIKNNAKLGGWVTREKVAVSCP